MVELKEDLYAAKKEEVSNNAYLVQTTVQGIVDGICKSLNKLMDSIYFEIIEPGVENATTSQIEQKFLELANCLFYVNGKCDELQIYSGVSSIGLKTAYNEAYLNPTLEKQKPTVAELQASAENKTLYDNAVNETYSKAAKMVKSKIDCGGTMLSSLSKVLSRRMSEQRIEDRIPATPQTFTPGILGYEFN